MNQTSNNYAKVLLDLNISKEVVENTKELFKCKELFDALNSPIVSKNDKHKIIDKVFSLKICNYLKVLCDYGNVGLIYDIFDAYDKYVRELNEVLKAELVYVTPPEEEQFEEIKEFIRKEYNVKQVQIETVKDESIIGGFILKTGKKEYDWSLKSRINQLTQHLKVK